MNSSRRKWSAILEALGVPPSARRSAATPASPACESLEGRQLLAGGLGFGGPGMAGVADVSTSSAGSTTPPADWGAQGRSSGHLGSIGKGLGAASLSSGAAWDGTGTMGLVGQGGFGDQGGFGGRGMMVPGGGSGPGTAPTVDQAQLQADMEKLRTDSQAIHDKSQVTPAMEATVRDDIKAIKGAETSTPDKAAEATLQADIKTARSDAGGPTDAQLAQVQADQDAIDKSQGVNAALISKLDADQLAIKTASGVTDADRTTLADDQAAIKADFAKIQPPATVPTTTSTAPPTSTPPAPAAIAPPTSPPLATSTTTTPAVAATASTTPTQVAPPAPTTPSTPTAPPTVPTAMHVMHQLHGHGGHGRPFGRGARGPRA